MSSLRCFLMVPIIFISINSWAATQIICKSTSCSADQPNGGTAARDMCKNISGMFTFNMTTVPVKDTHWSNSFLGEIIFSDRVMGTERLAANYFVDLSGNYNFWYQDSAGSVIQAYVPSNVALPGRFVYGSAHGPIMYTTYSLNCSIK